MGRNRNKGARNAERRGGTQLQAGGRPQARGYEGHGASGTRKKDTGLPAFFKQRHAHEAEKKRMDRSQAHVGEGDSSLSATRHSTLLAELQQSTGHDDASAAGPSRRGADASRTGFEFDKAARDLALVGKRDSSTKAFMRDVKGVIENSDVILQVLDARDPLGSRSRQTELMAMGSGKKVVLVMNKIDLIPTSSLQAWLRYLRNDFPTLAFKSSTQKQRSNLKQGQGDVPLLKQKGREAGPEYLAHGSESIGATALLQLLKNYARTSAKGSNLKQQLTVGVVGPPNVGKSSLINSLLRSRACAVASTPGWTKVVQGVLLEKGIRLLDCPGVVLGGSLAESGESAGESGNELHSDEAAWSMLRNTVKVELIDDPIAPIHAMLRRVDPKQLETLYNIEGGFNESDAHDFLLRVSLLRGKLRQGGVPDLEGAARIVLHDWNTGKIAFHTMPPAVHPSMMQTEARLPSDHSTAPADTNELTSGTSLLTGFSEAFDLDSLFGEADAEALGKGADEGNSIKTQNTGGNANGKFLVAARERRFAGQDAEEGTVEAIQEDEDGPPAVGDLSAGNTTSTSLGKRRRGMDDMAPSDDESSIADEEERDDQHTFMSDSEIIKDDTEAEMANDRDLVHSGRLEAAKSIQQTMRERELLGAFSRDEVAGLAKRRSDVRKAAKKNKKRLRKSGAGLVDALESSLAFAGAQDPSSESQNVQAADQPARKSTVNGKRSAEDAVRRGLFDVLVATDKPVEPSQAASADDEEEL